MKNINLNQFLMLLMLSVTSSQIMSTVYYEQAYPAAYTVDKTVTVTQTDNTPAGKGYYQADMPLSEQLDIIADELKDLKRPKMPCDRSEVILQIDLLQRKIDDLDLVELDDKLYDKQLNDLNRQLKIARSTLKRCDACHKNK